MQVFILQHLPDRKLFVIDGEKMEKLGLISVDEPSCYWRFSFHTPPVDVV